MLSPPPMTGFISTESAVDIEETLPKNEGARESSYCATDSSLSSELGAGGGGRGSSRSSLGSSLSASANGSVDSPHGQNPMQYSDDEDEGKEGYKVGGYHAVKVSIRSCSNLGYVAKP